MNNAEAIFNDLRKYSDVQNLIGKQEDIFLDFKERGPRWASPEKLSDDEKRLFRTAASGFAHQEGGVLVWGIEARKDSNGIDQAKTLAPFKRVKRLKQALEDAIKYATEPIVDGIAHRAVFINDDEVSDEGFVVSYFPKSQRVHRALNNATADFYKRHGDSFTPLSTEEVRALFFRTLAPDLEFIVRKDAQTTTINMSGSTTAYSCKFGLRNVGTGIARFVSLYFGLVAEAGVYQTHWYDGEGGLNFHIGKLISAPEYERQGHHFILNGDILIYPGQSMMLFSLTCVMHQGQTFPPVKVKVFAENMVPKEKAWPTFESLN
jgi:Schlafen, AlbA_2